MSLALLQRGQGARRPLVLCYYIGPPAAFVSALGPGPCIMTDLDDGLGRFAKAPGAGGVEGIDAAIAAATRENEFEPSAIILVGWSAGCQAVREQLRGSAARIDAAIALDGISGAVPPLDAQMAPWLAFATRAADDPRALCIVTHTQQTYTEELPPATRFASTATTAALLCAAVGVEPPGVGAEAAKGGFFCISSPSKKLDGMAHIGQVRTVGPLQASKKLVPWLVARGEPSLPGPSKPPAGS